MHLKRERQHSTELRLPIMNAGLGTSSNIPLGPTVATRESNKSILLVKCLLLKITTKCQFLLFVQRYLETKTCACARDGVHHMQRKEKKNPKLITCVTEKTSSTVQGVAIFVPWKAEGEMQQSQTGTTKRKVCEIRSPSDCLRYRCLTIHHNQVAQQSKKTM